ncbi:MAG TPA: hypothetical protein VI488_03330 [Candidatus Angelobacter sp.]
MQLAKSLAIIMLVLSFSSGLAQQGTAPPGYYPRGYVGDTWTGQITAVDADKREITLTYTGRKGTQNFVAYVPEHYKVHLNNGREQDVKMSDFRIGGRIKVYYMLKTTEVNGQKVKRNEVIRIDVNPSAD